MTKKEYNGWYNYETWLAKLWMDNDEGTQAMCNDMAQEAWDSAEAGDIFTREEQAACDLEDRLKESFEETQPELTGFWADMINAALSEINWREIAEHMIEDVDKEVEA